MVHFSHTPTLTPWPKFSLPYHHMCFFFAKSSKSGVVIFPLVEVWKEVSKWKSTEFCSPLQNKYIFNGRVLRFLAYFFFLNLNPRNNTEKKWINITPNFATWGMNFFKVIITTLEMRTLRYLKKKEKAGTWLAHATLLPQAVLPWVYKLWILSLITCCYCLYYT